MFLCLFLICILSFDIFSIFFKSLFLFPSDLSICLTLSNQVYLCFCFLSNFQQSKSRRRIKKFAFGLICHRASCKNIIDICGSIARVCVGACVWVCVCGWVCIGVCGCVDVCVFEMFRKEVNVSLGHVTLFIFRPIRFNLLLLRILLNLL